MLFTAACRDGCRSDNSRARGCRVIVQHQPAGRLSRMQQSASPGETSGVVLRMTCRARRSGWIVTRSASRDTEEAVGYRGVTACSAAGITYRQLDYWARTGLVVPSVRDASGSGTQRLYSFRDIVVLKVVKRLLDAGVSLQNIRKAIETLRQWGEDDLATHDAHLRRHDRVRVPVRRGGRRPAPGRPGRLRHRHRRRLQGDPGLARRTCRAAPTRREPRRTTQAPADGDSPRSTSSPRAAPVAAPAEPPALLFASPRHRGHPGVASAGAERAAMPVPPPANPMNLG